MDNDLGILIASELEKVTPEFCPYCIRAQFFGDTRRISVSTDLII